MTEMEKQMLEDVLKEVLKPISKEQTEKIKKEQKVKEEYLKRVKLRFLNYARSLPGAENETASETLFKIKGEIKNNEVVSLKAYTWPTYIEEEVPKIFDQKHEEKYFTIDINGNVEVKSDEFPEELLNITKQILSDDAKEVSNGKTK